MTERITSTWTDGEILYAADLNDTNKEIMVLLGVTSAQNYFELLKQSGDCDNEDYLIADIFTDADGAKDTIVTGDSSADYDTVNDRYSCTYSQVALSGTTNEDGIMGAATNPDNFFDGSDGTYAQFSSATHTAIWSALGKTFATPKNISHVDVYVTVQDCSNGGSITLQKYDGYTWSNVATLASTGGSIVTYNGEYEVNLTNCYGLRIYGSSNDAGTGTNYHKYYNFTIREYVSNKDVETTTLIALDGTEKGIIVFDKSTKPTGTSINVDVVGSSTLSAQAVRSYIDISSFTASNLSLDFNLVTTDTGITPSLYGYGVVIIK